MTDGVSVAEAMADKSALGTYQDQPVLKAKVKLTKAGDGLSKSLSIAPQLLPVRSKVMLLVEAEVALHAHKPMDGVDAFELIQTLEATTVTIVDDKGSATKLERQRRKLEEADNKSKGRTSLKEAGDPDFNPDSDLDAAEAALAAGDDDGDEESEGE